MGRCWISFEPKYHGERLGGAVKGGNPRPSFELSKKLVSVLRDFWEFQLVLGTTDLALLISSSATLQLVAFNLHWNWDNE